MTDPLFKLKSLEIPGCWKVVKHDFVNLEPDNDFPIENVFYHFDQDLFNATFNDYDIDLGFYGGYSDNNRSGFFKIVVFKGGFTDGEFFEFFISRSTEKIAEKLNFYLKEIPSGLLDNVAGVKYDNHYDHSTFHVFSAIENTDYRLTETQLDEIAKPKT